MNMEHPRKLIHTMHIPIRWGDMDAMGHVNNTLYFRYMEQARIEWRESLDLADADGRLGVPVLVNASCTFLIPLTYPGKVEVRLYAGRAGRSSLQTYCQLRLQGDEKLYAEGTAKIVWIDRGSGKSIPLPEPIRLLAEDPLVAEEP